MRNIKSLITTPIRNYLKANSLYLIGNRSMHGSPANFAAIMFSRKLAHFDFFYDKVANVEGDVIESGIWWGYGLLAHLRFVKPGNRNRKIIGFDSFQGHSTPHAKDLKGGKFAKPGSIFAVSESDVWKTLMLGTEKTIEQLKTVVTIVPGWMQETMPVYKANNPDLKIALIHCDPDIYEPVFATLSNFWGNLSQGGVVAIGRLHNPEYMGKTEAVQDFLKTIPADSYRLESLTVQELDTNISLEWWYLVKENT